MRQANPRLTPARVKQLLMLSATRVPGAPDERQGAGAVDAGRAIAAALADTEAENGADRKAPRAALMTTPHVSAEQIEFVLCDRTARSIALLGSWDHWRAPGAKAVQIEKGVWRATVRRLPPGRYAYKYLLNGETWIPDPANPLRVVDDGGNVNSMFEL